MILDDGINPIVFTDELFWTDEFQWTPVVQSKKYALGGTLIIQEAKKQAGRPITLIGDDKSWESRSIISALYAASLNHEKQFTLTLYNGNSKNVMFDRSQPPVQATPVLEGKDTDNSDQYILQALRFIEVPAGN